MWIGIIAIVAMAVWLLVIIVVRRPEAFAVSRSIIIKGHPTSVFSHVNTLRKWEAWSPWAKLAPNSKSTFDGAVSGVGSSMGWVGNRKVGQGKMTITESEQDKLVRLRLEFLKPMKATNTAEFTFQEEGGGTLVTWTMLGKNKFMGKLFTMFVDCEKMVGRDFEKGLANLKGVVEGAGTAAQV